VLVGALLVWSVLEAVLRDEFGLLVLTKRPDDPAWRPLVLIVSVVIAATLLWRRSHPLGAVAVAFGTIIAFDVARIFLIDAAGLTSVAALLLLPYSLFRWGSGREWAIGLGFVVVWLVTTHIADPTEVRDVVSTVGFFLFSAALGASVRFHTNSRSRDIEQAKLRERNLLARELHDAVGHHVSAIAIQAQGGRMMVASNPDRALNALETIEQAASRALTEMRAMVGMLRDGEEPDFSPQPGASDIEGLAGRVDGQPEVEVRVSGDLDGLSPAVDVALYRIAQEAITNATRHARHATQIVVDVERKVRRYT
jgi:signal transduction histidine kinase